MNRHDDFFPLGPKPSTTGTIFYLLFGPLLWAGQLTVAYGGHTLACVRGSSPELADAIVIVVTALALVALTGFLIWQDRCARALGQPALPARDRATDSMARLLVVLSLPAVLWGGATVGLVAACVAGR
ncbi:hypothetical protein [Chelativorans salis]|uniref:Transmembrane protein n=1 Tax=Chelativorans salis TaxID=2978478 RepID=A0ABT2LHF5_9HYPH|nr:hypothetical protein [Chelativorans sp. EGI FJ00035]MCT7373986.1 hypothetical protein [Chelativorans sp. EGI FJ00035]